MHYTSNKFARFLLIACLQHVVFNKLRIIMSNFPSANWRLIQVLNTQMKFPCGAFIVLRKTGTNLTAGALFNILPLLT